MRKAVVILCCLVWSLCLFGQEQSTRRQQADKLFEREEYYQSLKFYLPIAAKGKADIRLIERVAACYRLINLYPEAEAWYAKAVARKDADPQSTKYYAEALLNNLKFDEAKAQLVKYYSNGNDQTMLAFRLASIDSAALWLKRASLYKVQNLKALNSIYSDWGLNYYGKTALDFVSDRSRATGMYNRTGAGWLKPYLADVKETLLGELGLQLNSNYHIGPIEFSATEDTAYVTVTSSARSDEIPIEKVGSQKLYTRRLELLIAHKVGGTWGSVTPFKFNDAKNYSVGHAALSKNGQTLYFTSDMPGSVGKTDIWYCKKLRNGSWDKPVNCGKSVNTAEVEAFPSALVEGKLHFSSKGWAGMGGFDIFSASLQMDDQEPPANLKHPINSTADDFCFISRDGKMGYLSSNRAGGVGNDDIYRFSYSSLPHSISTKPVSTKPIAQQPALTSPNTIPPDGKLQPGKTYLLRNIYYDLDKADIRFDAARELDYLFEVLKVNPELKIELSAHTDSRASDDYNLTLSQRRAEAAVAYLWQKGISRQRLTPKGYGESKLLNRCANGVACSEEEHQANRRTEITTSQ